MKRLFFVIFTLFTTCSHAQLTNAEVFNFEIGDVFQHRYSSWYVTGAMVQLDTIVAKVVSADTITYTIHRINENIGPWPTTFDYLVETLVVTNLNAICFSDYLDSTQGIFTEYMDTCHGRVNVLESNYDSTVFEPPIWTIFIYEGLGGPYETLVDYSVNTQVTHELVYSNTAQWGECGNYQSYFLGLEETHAKGFPRQLMKIVDFLGREVDPIENTLQIYLYSDGSTEKRVISSN